MFLASYLPMIDAREYDFFDGQRQKPLCLPELIVFLYGLFIPF